METYDTYLAFAPNEGLELRRARRHSALKEMATVLGNEGWRICGIWQTVQGGVQGFGILCQRPQGVEYEGNMGQVVEMMSLPPLLGERPTERHIETVTLTALQMEQGFTCPQCGMVSHNATDIVEGYCGNCHAWTGERDLNG